MKTKIILSCLLMFCLGKAIGMPPLMKIYPAPEISITQATELAATYTAKLFPKDSSWYCVSARLEEGGMRPVRNYRHWDLLYRHAGAERSLDEKTDTETFGDFHVYVTMTGEVSHESPVTWPVVRDADPIQEYFDSLGTNRIVVESTNLLAGSREAALVNWLKISNEQIQRLTTGGAFRLVLSKAKPADPNAYAAAKVRGLDANRTYIQFQIIPGGLACPEFHGVMEQKPPKLISFWGEGA